MGAEKAIVEIKVGGTIGIDRSEEFAKLCREALDGAEEVTLDLAAVEDMDLAGVQVLYSAKRYARISGKTFKFKGAVQASLSRRLLSGGFVEGPVEDASALDAAMVLMDQHQGGV